MTRTLKTFRRDKLRRLVEAGKLITVGTYHFEDMTGVQRTDTPMPVAIAPRDWRDRKAGICYLRSDEFDGKSGCCYQDDSGVITLIVHGNSNYDFRMAEEAA